MKTLTLVISVTPIYFQASLSTIGFDRLCVIPVILDGVRVHDSGRRAWHTKWPISKEAAQESALWVRWNLGHRGDGEIEAFHRRKNANQAEKEGTACIFLVINARLYIRDICVERSRGIVDPISRFVEQSPRDRPISFSFGSRR